jgi:RNA polymerase sigma-70 factor (ECF subfamily)
VGLRESFQDLVDRQYDGLCTYAAWLTGGAAEADDLVHEAFLAAFDLLAAQGAFTGDPGKWLRGTTRNLVHAWWRKRRRLPQPAADALKDLADRMEEAPPPATDRAYEMALAHCLDRLPPADRDLVERRYAKAFDPGRLAATLGIQLPTLRVRLFRLRQALRGCVENRLKAGT